MSVRPAPPPCLSATVYASFHPKQPACPPPRLSRKRPVCHPGACRLPRCRCPAPLSGTSTAALQQWPLAVALQLAPTRLLPNSSSSLVAKASWLWLCQWIAAAALPGAWRQSSFQQQQTAVSHGGGSSSSRAPVSPLAAQRSSRVVKGLAARHSKASC